jgi:hypothetical protein
LPEGKPHSDDQPLEPLILVVRGQRVILDADLGRLYGASQLFDPKVESRNWTQFATSSKLASRHGLHRGAAYRPWAFTEHGALMAANVIRSEGAVRMSVFVVRAFVRLREQATANAAILKRLAEIDQTLLQHDSALRDVYRKLQSLLAPPPETPQRRIGF